MNYIQIESNFSSWKCWKFSSVVKLVKKKTEKPKEKPPVRRSMTEERWFWLWRVCWALKSKSLITEESIEDKPFANTSELCRSWSSPSEPWELEGSVDSTTTLSFSSASIVVWFSSVRGRKWCCDWEELFMCLTTELNGIFTESFFFLSKCLLNLICFYSFKFADLSLLVPSIKICIFNIFF